MAGCLSDGEREQRLYNVAAHSRQMVEQGDTLGALRWLEEQVMKIPKPKTGPDSTMYGWMYARLAFLYYHSDSSGALSSTYYRAAYPMLRYLPEAVRTDALRWTALVAAERGDTTMALLHLYESRHRALALGDSVRTARADTCLSYLHPKEMAAYHGKPFPILPLLAIILVVWFASILGARHVIMTHLGANPRPGAAP